MDNFTPIKLTTSVNNIVAPSTFVLDKLFGRTEQHLATIIQVDILSNGKKLAPLVKRGSPAKVLSKDGRKTQFFEPPHIRVKKEFTPSETKHIRGEGVPVVTTGQSVSAGEQYVASEQQKMKDEIVRRLEWLACQSIQGGFTYVDASEGIDIALDYLMPAAHKPTLTGNALWSDAVNSDPEANISSWQTLIGQATGKGATMAIFTNAVFQALMANEKLAKKLDNRKVQNGTIDSSMIAEKYGVLYRGEIDGVDLYEYNEQYVDEDDNTQSMIPTDSFILIAPSADYRLHYAMTEDLKAGNVAMPYFSKMWETEDPSALWMLTESNPLTVPHQPAAAVVAKVL